MSESGKIRVTPYLNRPVLASGAGQRAAPVRVDDSALIRQAQQGDTAAFEELVRQYDRAVLRLAVHLTGSPEDGQDIYQEAFLRAYINLARFRFECSFYTWIYRIVTNLCLDHLRKKRSRGRDLNTTHRLRMASRKICSTACPITARRPARSEALPGANCSNASSAPWAGSRPANGWSSNSSTTTA